MKAYPAVFVLLALALVTHAKIDDQSYVHKFAPECKSALRVAIQGFGKGVLKSTARKNCEKECRVGIEDFKRKRCKELCGFIVFYGPTPPPGQECKLCLPDRNAEVARCRTLVGEGLSQCRDGCQTNPSDYYNGYYEVSGASNGLTIHFKSKIV